MMREDRHLHVFDHGHGCKRLRDLKRACHTMATNRMRREPQQVFSIKHNRAPIRTELAVDHVERGGLAGAIGTDQCQQLPGTQLEVNAIHRMDAAKRFAKPAHAQKAHRATLLFK